MTFRICLIYFLMLVLFPAEIILAQQTSIYKSPEMEYRAGVDLFDKEKYGAALERFASVIDQVDIPDSPLRIEAEYHQAICALELYHKDAAYKLSRFLQDHPANSHTNLINFQLGRLYYRNKSYRKSLEFFQSVDLSELSANEKAEFYFKEGYCYFKRKKNDEAKAAFTQAVKYPGKYASPSSYYLAHMIYTEGRYEEALAAFKALEDDPNFKSVAPYYVVQILFLQKKYSDVIEQAPPLLVNASSKRAAELNRILGQSYFYTRKYDKALPYLQQYQTSSKHSLTREDNYIMGYALLQTGQEGLAVDYLQRATGSRDTLEQFAYYYLASCYLKAGKKQFAANAFYKAYKLPFDREIREDALFKQAQLAFELSSDPYNEAVKALRSYIMAYPESERAYEAYHFLFSISMATRNFDAASEALENIQEKGPDYNKRLQQITFYRAIAQFNQFNYKGAGELFAKAGEIKGDKEIFARSKFWLAESFYRLEDYWAAKKYYLEFFKASRAKQTGLYNLANYNLGYVNFKRKEYQNAAHYFKQFIDHLTEEKQVMVADAFLRLGDSYFVGKKYDLALNYYGKAAALKAIDVDYALLQKAKALGVLLRYPEKITSLKKISTDYPSSTYISEAYYELAGTYLQTGNQKDALITFKKIAADFPKSNYAVKARLKSGLIYYNSDLNDLAIQTFKGVVADFPDTPESREALASLRNIYVETGHVNDFFEYTKSLKFAAVSISEQDSLSYISAENQYMDGEYADAAKSFSSYITQFPEGAYRTPANYYLAECLVQQKKTSDALSHYQMVLDQPQGEFTRPALLKAADISFDLGNNQQSLEYFNRLAQLAVSSDERNEVYYGQMKNNYVLGNYAEAIDPADQLLNSDKLSDEMKLEALMIRAKSLDKTDDALLAKAGYKEIVELSQGEAGAEALYHVARIEFDLSDYEPAEKDVFKLVNNYSAYDYWVAKSFILLADIYTQKGNIFQAKQTLQSVIDNYDGKDLRDLAVFKLNGLESDENPNFDGGPGIIEQEADTVEMKTF